MVFSNSPLGRGKKALAFRGGFLLFGTPPYTPEGVKKVVAAGIVPS